MRTLELVSSRSKVTARYHRLSVDVFGQHTAAGCAYQCGERELGRIAQPLGVDDGIDYCTAGIIRRIDEDAINRQLNNGGIVLVLAAGTFLSPVKALI